MLAQLRVFADFSDGVGQVSGWTLMFASMEEWTSIRERMYQMACVPDRRSLLVLGRLLILDWPVMQMTARNSIGFCFAQIHFLVWVVGLQTAAV